MQIIVSKRKKYIFINKQIEIDRPPIPKSTLRVPRGGNSGWRFTARSNYTLRVPQGGNQVNSLPTDQVLYLSIEIRWIIRIQNNIKLLNELATS